jgi:uncharacterized protein (DUF2267 family)
MSATGLEVFDRTLQTTNTWLGEIMQQLETDRHVAWKVLSVVLHKLRDRLPVELAAHLGSQLPLLVRGVFYDQYQPARQPSDCRTLDAFVAEVAEWLADTRPVDPKLAIRAVFAVLSRHVPAGQLDNVRGALPSSLRSFWEDIEETGGRPPGDDDRADVADI